MNCSNAHMTKVLIIYSAYSLPACTNKWILKSFNNWFFHHILINVIEIKSTMKQYSKEKKKHKVSCLLTFIKCHLSSFIDTFVQINVSHIFRCFFAQSDLLVVASRPAVRLRPHVRHIMSAARRGAEMHREGQKCITRWRCVGNCWSKE